MFTTVLAPHPDPASRLIRATHEVSFPCSESKCRWYVSNLSSFAIRFVGIWMKDRHQVWRYATSVTRSWLRAPLMACQSPAEGINSSSSAYAYFCETDVSR